MSLIQTTVIQGGAVYGVEQLSYVVDGVTGKDFGAALAAAAFRQTVAIEAAAAGYADVVRVRERKVDELGKIMAYLNRAYATLPVGKKAEPGDTATVENGSWVNETASGYGVTLVFKEGTSAMTRDNLMRGQNDIQYALDTEDNNLQQDLVGLQSLFSKRDNAYSTASRVVRKVNDAASSTIGNIQ